ncbi:MAG: hydantoinase/oxoprolinase family protein [Chloroflexi bacterium]|nr:hydantoinase/oxoprolinase family protein [Chloroflexota bacterium]
MFRAGIDIGGTFTDIAILDHDQGVLLVGKVLTTPADPSVGALVGLSRLLSEHGIAGERIAGVIHGTTLVANVIIERKGAKTALITTKGFRDILEIGREKRYDIYDLFLEMPPPLVPRRMRKEVSERLDENGVVVTPLDQTELELVVRQLKDQGVQSLAVCFLHSFRNPEHERAVRTVVEGLAPNMFTSLSVEVVPEVREYERTSTTVANAYAQPTTRNYLSKMQKELHGLGVAGDLRVVLSSGGITTVDAAERFPVRIIESGPAGGAIAASVCGESTGVRRVMAFDMGGTTAKICLIRDGKPEITTDFEVARVHRFRKGSGLPIRLPVVEMIEIGAGGGSIARADEMGLLKVGPDSAGADPGPVCYDQGGEDPTVTDADLVLGYLSPSYFLGGRMRLDEEKARKALATKIADPLGLEVPRAAWGIQQVVDENMANAARLHAVEKGQDLSNYALVAFGGAGPVHAYRVARKLKIDTVVCPSAAGVESAVGFLMMRPSFDFVRTYICQLGRMDFDVANQILRDMEVEGIGLLAEMGMPHEQIEVERSCDMRYVGQGHEIRVLIPNGLLSSDHAKMIRSSFDAVYKDLYYLLNPDVDVEALNWRVVVRGPRPRLDGTGTLLQRTRATGRQSALKGRRKAFFPEHEGYVDCAVYDRYALSSDSKLVGPAIIEEEESTTVVGPGAHISVDESLNLIITVAKE